MTQSVVGALRVVLGLDTAQFEKGMTAAQKQLRGVEKSMQQTGNSMMQGGAALTIGITAPFIALMASSRQAAKESRAAVGQVNAALASMGNASGRTTKQLQDNAKALQGLSTFDDDDILRKSTANLLTFGRISGEVFDRAQLAAVNLSARMDGDLQAATLMVGKALNAPTQGLTALRRAGIQFTEAQKNQIKEMERSGNVAGAQSIMLAELERQFGGAAKALRDADPDSASRDAWRELQETLGEIALNVLPPLVAALTTVMETFNRLSPEMQAFVVGGVAILAALGPVVTVMGGLVTAGGSVVGMLAKWGPSMTGAAGGTTMLGRAMIALRTSMMFLVATPWGLLITAIAVAIGLLIMKSREATPAQKALERATDDLSKATKDYEEATLLANTASGEAKVAAMDQVRALRVIQEEKRRTAVRALQLAKAELAQAAAARAAYNARLSNAGEGMGTYARVSGRGPRTMGDNQRRGLEDSAKALESQIAEADAAINRIDAGLNSPLGNALGSGGSDGAGGRTSSGPSADQRRQEAEQRRRTIEDNRTQIELQEAQLTNNLEQVRALERQDAVRQRTRSLIDAGILKDAEASAEAERVQKRLDEAQEEQWRREEAEGRRDFERRLWEIDGRQDMIDKIERQVMQEERIVFWRSKGYDLITATSAAISEIAEMDLARADAAERSARAAKQQHDMELARLRGDDREVRRLGRDADIEARTREYMGRTDNPLDPDAARRRAEREVSELDDAEMTGRVRDFLKEGWRAALDGDLSDFASKWVTEWAGKGLEDALNSLADLLMQIFKSVDLGGMTGGGAGGGVGFDWGSIGSSVGSWFKKLPGFANGGSILPGGSGGIDSQLVQFRKSPGERVDIYHPGSMRKPSGASPISFDLRGALMTTDLLTQMETMASASGGAAIRGAREVVPRDQAKVSRYSLGRGR